MKNRKANPYDPDYVMKRDNCSYDEALDTIQKLKDRNAWNKGKKIQKANPYDPDYVMKRDNCSYDEAMATITKFKSDKATNLDNFIKKYGINEGQKKYQEWKDKSLRIGHELALINGKSQSKFSPEYYIRHGYNEDDAKRMAIEYQYKNSPLHIEYYISRGKTLIQAKKEIRKIHDKKIGIDSYRVYLEEKENLTPQEIDTKIKQVRGNFSKEVLGDTAFNNRLAKMRNTFEKKGMWIPLEDLSDYELYKREVWKYTNLNDLSLLENYDKRALAGTDDGYHLDHKYSISQGYINQVSPQLIGSLTNLEFIPWEENIKKQANCSITIEELLNEN